MKRNDELQAKPGNGLLGSGQWFFVNIRQPDNEIEKFIMDEVEYSTFFRQLNGDGKFVDVRGIHYFWSNVHSFGPIVFEEGVLSQIKLLDPVVQEFVRKHIKAGFDISTMDKLRSEISYFLSL